MSSIESVGEVWGHPPRSARRKGTDSWAKTGLGPSYNQTGLVPPDLVRARAIGGTANHHIGQDFPLAARMVDPSGSGNLPSLLSATFRRSLVLGRLYLGIGLAYSVILTLSLASSGASSFDSEVPLLFPIFGVLGSMGGMVAFSNDRVKGVHEYLIVYGVRPRKLFVYSLLASLGVMSIQMAVSVALALGVSVALWHAVPLHLVGLLAFYSVPMSYASAAFACMVGMYWTVLSSPRTGMSSPIGLMPVVGIAPAILTLVAAGVVEAQYGARAAPIVLGVALAAILGLALVLLSQVGRLLRTDRLLSPM